MKEFQKLVNVKKITFLVINGYKTGKELEDDNPGAHYHNPALDDKLFHHWSHCIKVDHRKHSEEDIDLILDDMSQHSWFRNVKHFNYYYFDQYEITFCDGEQFVKLASEPKYNCSKTRKIVRSLK